MKRISKRRIFTLIGTIVFTIMMFSLFIYYKDNQPKNVLLSFEVLSENVDGYDVYYDTDGDKLWNDKEAANAVYSKTGEKEQLKFSIPSDSKNIRIDFGTSLKQIQISNLSFKKNGTIKLEYDKLQKIKSDENDVNINNNDEAIDINVTGEDSYIVLDNISDEISPILKENIVINIGLGILSLILGYVMATSFLELKRSIDFIKISINNKSIIKSLSKNDFKSKYASSYLGIIWGFIHPLITIAVYWFVFQVGFRSGDVGNVPYVLWFISGIIPWFFFSEALPSATNAFIEYSYLVKKVVFKIEILPTVKIISAVFVHLFFILFLFIITLIYKRMPTIHILQFIYYSFAMMFLVFSVSIFTSAVVLFFRDLSQVVSIIVNVGFWATPIGWQIGILPANIGRLFKLNPMYYIVTGYRDSFIDKIFIWQRPYETLYFWLFCIVTLCLGVRMYYKLKPHFSDVL